MNGGKIIAAVLKAHGVETLFTLCGGHIAPIYVEAEKSGIRVVDVRDEASALFAADAAARLSGIPGVAAVTAGPGVTNAVTALKNAQMAQSPLLLLGGATATLLRGRGALQDIDQMALVKPHVKWAVRVSRLRDVAGVITRALHTALSGVPGPVFVEIPVDLLYDEATVREWYGQKSKGGDSIADKLLKWYIERHLGRLFGGVGEAGPMKHAAPKIPVAGSGDFKAAALALKKAQRPVLLIGSGAMLLPRSAAALSEAVTKLGIPTYVSGMARGLLGHTHPLLHLHERKKALREADLILLAGVPCDFRLDYGSHLNRHALKIAVNRSRRELRKNIKPQQAVQADPGAFLIRLAETAADLPEWPEWKALLYTLQEAREQEIARQGGAMTKGINPVTLFMVLEKMLPANSVLIADGGDFAATAAYTLRPRKPLGWLDPGVFGTLGVGGGFALGAALHYPGDYVWIIYGDGSAAYSLMEFDTFAKNGMKVCAIIGNNGSWEQIARDQITMLGSAVATTMPRSDYHRIAEAFACAGERVEMLESFAWAVQRAIASMDKGVPYIINADIGSTDFRKGSISM
jgi:acetolactate synthase-like protein